MYISWPPQEVNGRRFRYIFGLFNEKKIPLLIYIEYYTEFFVLKHPKSHESLDTYEPYIKKAVMWNIYKTQKSLKKNHLFKILKKSSDKVRDTYSQTRNLDIRLTLHNRNQHALRIFYQKLCKVIFGLFNEKKKSLEI